VKLLVQPENELRAGDLARRYGHVQTFLPKLIHTIGFEATPAGSAALDAWRTLPSLRGRKRIDADEVPLELVSSAWQKLVVQAGDLNRAAYTVCIVEKFSEALRRRDVFVPNSRVWGDPRAKLLSGRAWEAVKPDVCKSLNLDPLATQTLDALASELDATYRAVAERVAANDKARVGVRKDRKGDRVSVTPLKAEIEPQSLVELRAAVKALLPRVDLPELLLEVAMWTGFVDGFTHLSEASARLENLSSSVCAVLIADACNVGFEPVTRERTAAFSRDRLMHVDQNYVRAETIAAANARLVDFQAGLALAQSWGGGQLASVDGMRFRVPVRTMHAGANPKYFGVGRGVTYLNFVSDQATGFHAFTVPGTLRDSLGALDGLLEHNTSFSPKQLVGDTHVYADMVFGLCRLLGYQFSPRIANLDEMRFWRVDKDADYGVLNDLARNRIDLEKVRKHWEDILRVVGSLVTRSVRASDILRVLHNNGNPTALGRAIEALGRIPKTVHLLQYMDDEAYRRLITAQLNLHELRHKLARAVFHGHRGELRQKYVEGMEDQLGALGLVVNAIVLWNTRYLGAAIEHLRHEGKVAVLEEDVSNLSPLVWEHVNLLGRYEFRLGVQAGELRALRLDAQEEDLDGQESEELVVKDG